MATFSDVQLRLPQRQYQRLREGSQNPRKHPSTSRPTDGKDGEEETEKDTRDMTVNVGWNQRDCA